MCSCRSFTRPTEHAGIRFIERRCFKMKRLDNSRQSAANKMFEPQIGITSKRMFGPDAWSDTDEYESKNLSWTLGWGCFESEYGRAVFHTGHDSGAQNYAVLYPGSRLNNCDSNHAYFGSRRIIIRGIFMRPRRFARLWAMETAGK